MKLTIERNALLKTLGHVQSVVERRNTMPILSNVLIEAKGSTVSLTATDLELEIVEKADADIANEGATTAPAHTLFDIVRKLPDGAEISLSLDTESNRLAIDAGRSHFTLACLGKEEFPKMSGGEMPHSYSLPAGELNRLFKKTSFAISTEETRYYLNGIYLHMADGEDGARLRAVATDGHRLAQVEQTPPEGAAGMPGVIVPRKAVGEIGKLIDELDGDIAVALSDTKIRFSFADTVLTTKLIDGTFPDYTRVIPQGNDKKMEIDSRVFSQAVDRVSTISSEKTRSIKLSIETDQLTLSVNSPDSGTATEKMTASYSADAIEIGFNSRYLIDVLSQVEGDAVQVFLADPSAPTVLKDLVDDAALYVLMPMRV